MEGSVKDFKSSRKSTYLELGFRSIDKSINIQRIKNLFADCLRMLETINKSSKAGEVVPTWQALTMASQRSLKVTWTSLPSRFVL